MDLVAVAGPRPHERDMTSIQAIKVLYYCALARIVIEDILDLWL
jgi:hypothetical protein